MATLYIEPFSGLAGDMFLAALLDLKDERATLEGMRAFVRDCLGDLCTLEAKVVWRQNLSGTLLDVLARADESKVHRGLREIRSLLAKARLSERVRLRSEAVFQRIAVAEGRVHGCSPEEIHFHEVGAVDTIVDVVLAMQALEWLGVERVLAQPPVTGTGVVKCAHGLMPVPAPAVAELLRGRTIRIEGGGGERLTPTGAALLVELVDAFGDPGAFVARAVGYGAGHKDPSEGPPNLVRVQLGEAVRPVHPAAAHSVRRTRVWLMESNLDDATGEELGLAMQRLLAAGALDAWSVPTTMKKGRPGVVLCALASDAVREVLERVYLDFTPTLGVRTSPWERLECDRSSVHVQLEGRIVRVKVRRRPHARIDERDLSPEHDDLAALAASSGRGVRELERAAIQLALGMVAPLDVDVGGGESSGQAHDGARH
jgi:hypothetical protein